MPDPFVLVLLLTFITFGFALWCTPIKPHQLLNFWQMGFWELLSFSMQMVLIVVTGEAIAQTQLAKKFLRAFCEIPKKATTATIWLTFFSIILGWLHWGFGLIIASLAGKELAKTLHRKKITIHYPILGAAAYMSMLLWHAGITASAPLLINTPEHFLFKEIGLVPLSQTIFLPSNLIVCVVLILIIPLVISQLIPHRNIQTVDQFEVDLGPVRSLQHSEEKAKTFAEKLERGYLINAVIGMMGVIFLLQYFRNEGLNLNHNIINLMFLTLGILLHRNPMSYASAVAHSVRGTTGIILQFPFYGGIMGIMRESGLGTDIANLFVHHANEQSLPFFAYLASTFTKLFIPSGGGEWAVEGPVMIQAAKQLNAPIGLTTLGIAYGNMIGNMFQPFWAIPLLSIMGLKARDIMGYSLVVFFFAFPILAIALWIT